MHSDSRYGQFRLTLTLYILLGVFGLQIYQSWMLWVPNAARTFPIMPISSALPDVGTWSLAFVIALAIGLLMMLHRPFRLMGSVIGLASLLLLFTFDVLRIQAWTVQYAFFILLLGLSSSKPRVALRGLHLLLAFTYIWSGIHKVGPHFADAVFPWLMSVFDFSKAWLDSLTLAYAFGILEALAGLALLFSRVWRVIGLVCISLMHVLILAVLIQDDWNQIVWGWNIAMVLWLWIIVLPEDLKEMPWRVAVRKWPVAVVAVWMGFMPGMYLVGIWEHNLSLAMYSGLTTEAYLIFEEGATACLPAQIHDELETASDGRKQLLLDYWTLKEMQVPTYPKQAIFERFLPHFCSCLEKYNADLYISVYDRWSLTGTEQLIMHCQDGKAYKVINLEE